MIDVDTDVRAEYQGKAVLAAAGIAVPSGALARSTAEAQAIAERIGYPVVLKAQASQLVHKSDAGGVRVGIRDGNELAAAWIACSAAVAERAPEIVLDGFLVEAQCAAPVELIVSARRDPDWGLVLAAGLGGIWTEAFADVRLIAPDASPTEMLADLFALKAAPLLRGERGTLAVDVNAVVAVLGRLVGLLEANPRLREIEINPLAVSGTGAVALDVLFALDH
jgi:succinyl-CoA synthetase beta subunit